MKKVAVLMVDGAFAIFFHPHHGRFDRRVSPVSKGPRQKISLSRGGGGGPGGHGCTEPELTDALPGEYLNVFLLV